MILKGRKVEIVGQSFIKSSYLKDQRDSIACKALALHSADQGSILCTLDIIP